MLADQHGIACVWWCAAKAVQTGQCSAKHTSGAWLSMLTSAFTPTMAVQTGQQSVSGMHSCAWLSLPTLVPNHLFTTTVQTGQRSGGVAPFTPHWIVAEPSHTVTLVVFLITHQLTAHHRHLAWCWLQYGKQTVPISAEEENHLKYSPEKGMQLIGFMSLSEVPRHAFMKVIPLHNVPS